MNPTDRYQHLQEEFVSGWNTWNVRSIFSHVLMPQGVSISFGFKDYVERRPLTEVNLGWDHQDVVLGPHTYNGSYTEATLNEWSNQDHATPLSFRVRTAHTDAAGKEFVAIIEPVGKVERLQTPLLIIELSMLWNRPGALSLDGDRLVAKAGDRTVTVFTDAGPVTEPYVGKIGSPYLTVPVGMPVVVSTGAKRTREEAEEILSAARAAWEAERARYEGNEEMWDAMQTALAWNVIYEPKYRRAVCPVSRRWSINNRGYVLYLWDTYFAGYQAAATASRGTNEQHNNDAKALAYINLVEMTRAKHKAERPFVPNVEQANGFLSRDRSQPPVGSLCAREVYRIFDETWILELLYDDLKEWNEWWHATRRHEELLCYGSTPYDPVIGNRWETEEGEAVNGWFGASMESGWDGAVLYRDVPFDKKRHILKHWDATLNSLYVMDCRALADIADAIGKADDAVELRSRADSYQGKIPTLWNDKLGFFQNKNWETGEFSDIVAINGFFPLIAGAASDEQAVAVVQKHLLNPDDFWGTWALTTLSRSHPNFGKPGQYWDGRVWPPVNFLVYLGLRNYTHLPEVKAAADKLVENSRGLLLHDFREKRLVRENYDVETGSGVEAEQSAAFYHWGGLLALMSFLHQGLIESPQTAPR
ncbi:MAG: MGH1-like glycoside hydrolase domain-containing protein [Spirochaetales bacterium]